MVEEKKQIKNERKRADRIEKLASKHRNAMDRKLLVNRTCWTDDVKKQTVGIEGD